MGIQLGSGDKSSIAKSIDDGFVGESRSNGLTSFCDVHCFVGRDMWSVRDCFLGLQIFHDLSCKCGHLFVRELFRELVKLG